MDELHGYILTKSESIPILDHSVRTWALSRPRVDLEIWVK